MKNLYKIEYESWKDGLGNICGNYCVYEKGKLWGWNKCRVLKAGYFRPYWEEVGFDTEKEAREYVKRMREPLPQKPIIIL